MTQEVAMKTDFTYDALFFPDHRPLLANAEHMPPFDPNHTGFSLNNAWWLASLCQLAYCQDCQIGQELPRAGLRLERSFCGPSTQGFLASGNGYAVLVFRGTEIKQWLDIWMDAKFHFAPMRAIPKVHKGFQDALDEVWPEVQEALDQQQATGAPIWYTGYSLGAALATLTAARRPPAALVTFGSPRVGDLDFVRLLHDLPIHRFVNCCDVVAQAPPPAFGYWHVGELDFISATGHVLRSPESWHVARRQLAGQALYQTRLPWLHRAMVKNRLAADHAIVNYIAGIENDLARQAKTAML
jgi:hypothetical protein